MAQPHILKNFNAFVKGVGYAGIADEAKVPDLAIKTEDYRGAGMGGDMEIDQGMDKMDMEVTMSGREPGVLEYFGLANGASAGIRLVGAEQAPDGSVRKCEYEGEGILKKVDGPTLKAGAKGPVKFTLNCRHYKETIDGKVIVEIDIIAGTRKINGVDQNAAINQAIGQA
ncbi:phage major tail tube protein [Kordiimonas marina]|uniref:phage major tail tube protein n=1 Tax=Kordiimonas marina TaxID=2872312 RepID=UPI001FF4327C|nr:phage major tail tube protein [Kordiimonas marina]MCJ9428539.1 phage major tail tube protein [Kordiimonas marina]